MILPPGPEYEDFDFTGNVISVAVLVVLVAIIICVTINF